MMHHHVWGPTVDGPSCWSFFSFNLGGNGSSFLEPMHAEILSKHILDN